MASARKVHHATVLVNDLERAEEFYSGVLELPRIPRPSLPSKGAWYELAGVQLHLIWTEKCEEATARHVAFVVDDLDAVLVKVKAMGLPIWDDIQVEGFVRRHCRDPFGNGIELLQAVGTESAESLPSSSSVGEDGTWNVA